MFQFGNFYNQTNEWLSILGTLFGSIIGAAVSGYIAVRIFNKGILKQEQKEERQKIESLINKIKIFSKQLENINVYLKKQILEFDFFIKETTLNSYTARTPIEIPSHEINRIRKTETSTLVNIFEYLKFSNDEYLETINSLDYLFSVSHQWPADISKIHSKKNYDLSNTVFEYRREIYIQFTDFFKRTEFENPKNELAIFIDKLVTEYFNEPKKIGVLKYDYIKFFNPLHLELLKHTDSRDDIITNILSKTKDCIDILYTISESNKRLTNSFNDLKETFIKKVEYFELIINRINANY